MFRMRFLAAIVAILLAAGCCACLSEQKSSDGNALVGEHYDGGGVGDNGSGVALLLATAASS